MASYSPPAKRQKLAQDGEKGRLLSEIVLRQSPNIVQYLSVPELMKFALVPGLEFLSDEELDNIIKDWGGKTESEVITVLKLLKVKKGGEKEDCFQKFIVCIDKAEGHRGHKELMKIIKSKLTDEQLSQIKELKKAAESPEPSPYNTPRRLPRAVAFIMLEGQLVDEKFVELERKMWLSFCEGRYNDLEIHIKTIQNSPSHYTADCQVVGLWFKSLVLQHRDVEYSEAVQTLNDAKNLINQCVNQTILIGRIQQRKVQIYLMMGLKNEGLEEFKKAQEQLQFVGIGYDKKVMKYREAKILSATQPDNRVALEKVHRDALSALEKDDPYFLASYPSVILSKVAFHLHFAFGSKPTGEPPLVGPDDIEKAREMLSGFDEKKYILIEMRRYEYDLIQAELCRLEGNTEQARDRFTKLMHATGKAGNIGAIARHRLKWMSPPAEALY